MSLIKNKEAAQSSITLLKQTNYLIDARLSQPPSSTWKSAIRFDYKPKEQVLKNLEEYHNRPPPFFTRLKVRTLKLLRIPEREEFLLTRYHRHRIIPDDGVSKLISLNTRYISYHEFDDFMCHELDLLCLGV